MTDRELLEQAAKAAGIEWEPADTDAGKECELKFGLWLRIKGEPTEFTRRQFNPLHDDGDALRLAVKLDIDFYMGAGDGPEAWAGYYLPGRENKKHACQPVGQDPYAATRRAIVRAAAEIGRAMT